MATALPDTGLCTRAEAHADVLPVFDTVYVAGPPVLLAWTGTVLLALMLAGPFALLVTFAVVFAAVAFVAALGGAIFAAPYLVIRYLLRAAA